MKKFIALWTAVFMLLSMVGCSGSDGGSTSVAASETTSAALTDGTYTATSWGNNGEMEVQLVVAGGKISSVEILSHVESKGISDLPIEEIPARIVEAQSVGVDTISGATFTSNGIINAVKDCLEQAGGDLAVWAAPVEEDVTTPEDVTTDVVVIGSGAAGHSAAIYAAKGGANVILLEKQDVIGGTSLLSNSMFGSVETSVHIAEGKTETVEDLFNNYMKQEAATGAYAKEDAARILAENSSDRAEYLIDLGVELDHTSSAFILAPKGGSGLGAMVIPALTRQLNELGVDIRTGNKAVGLLTEDNKITGVEVETDGGNYVITCKAVVMATGGYAANKEMVSEYLPEWSDSIYYCSPGNTGDGLIMAQEVGVELVDMTVMKANPLVFYDRTHALTMNAAVNAGAIMVNQEGERFANEQGSYGISPIINDQTGGVGYIIFDNTLLEGNATMQSYYEKGYLTEAPSLEELAGLLEINAETLVETVSNYQEMVAAGEDTAFGRKTLADLYSGDTFYGIKIKPSIQGTFGGIPTNVETEVLLPDGTVFEGFYAVGECAQEGVNGLNPMTTNMVFGKIAGENAAAYVAE